MNHRVNISIPEVIHKLMQERPEINWSAIATSAFARLLDNISLEGEVMILRARYTELETKLKR